MPFTPIDKATSGDNAIVPAGAANQVIRVYGYILNGAGTVTAQWMSDVGGSAVELSGALSLAVATSIVAPPAPITNAQRGAYFETAPGKALNLKLGGNIQVSGHLEWAYSTK